MALEISGFSFEGPFASTDDLMDRSGVYVIVGSTASGYSPVDCGESAAVKSRVSAHERATCWQRRHSGTLMVAVLYTPGQQKAARVAIEARIRRDFGFPCGKI
ncbi:hypothetical protein [Allorhodopirellula solitaria]|uniref:GIY-YIG domain-containing protein n=1 Tax=Allorhodopirellula solitaria TaxID=2527987 RepID=A0A5C5YIX8_9BACT|nr:hypothetical protein [Allorhodopirellula solitaria]TWT74825.1 hypothetical protein CA85_01110 [Allorhodopirellula solitaria]